VKTQKRAILWSACLGLLLLSPVAVRAQLGAADAASTVYKASSPVTVYLRVDDKTSEITLVGRTDKVITYVEGKSGVGSRKQLEISKVQSAYFSFKYNYIKVLRHTQRLEWSAAVRIMLPILQPTLPYLDLPNNNALERVLEVGDYMMRSAEQTLRSEGYDDAEAQTKAKEMYKAAYHLFQYAGRGNWSAAGLVGLLKSYKCLVALDKPKTAERFFERLPDPAPGDRAYGLYWLLKAELEWVKKDYRAAMQAAVNSLCFENKDIDTFPDALLLSAQCYEEMQEWHRARDVYYEVARIFPATDYAAMSIKRLRFIMKKDLTAGKEKVPIEYIFFRYKEDMDEAVRDLLKQIDEVKIKMLYDVDEVQGAEGDGEGEKEETLDLDAPDQ
jgi:hypothetical protein